VNLLAKAVTTDVRLCQQTRHFARQIPTDLATLACSHWLERGVLPDNSWMRSWRSILQTATLATLIACGADVHPPAANLAANPDGEDDGASDDQAPGPINLVMSPEVPRPASG